MTKKLKISSNKIDKNFEKALATLSKAFEELGLDSFIIGATARDIILQGIYNIQPTVLTTDVDVASNISDWNKFEELKTLLVHKFNFRLDRVPHRVFHPNGTAIDIVPFGKIETSSRTIEWPNDKSVMNNEGISEAFGQSITVELSNNSTVKVASLPGLVVMKLISWSDRPAERTNDPKDIYFIMKNYGYDENLDRLYESEEDLITETFNPDLALSQLLGRDIARLLGSTLRDNLITTLDKELEKETSSRLIQQMIVGEFDNDGSSFDLAYEMLKSLREGLADVS